jgi:hypothetical protein
MKRIKSLAARLLNRAIEPMGLHIVKNEIDLVSSRFTGEYTNAVWTNITGEMGSLYKRLNKLGVNCTPDKIGRLRDFHQAYIDYPWKNFGGGIQYNNALVLFAVAQALNPELIVDSGTFRGFSAWVLGQACSHTQILSHDISLAHLKHREATVQYLENDWTKTSSSTSQKRCLCFFDDHVDQVRRLEEAYERGVEWAIFDDDTPVGATHNGHSAHSFPKLSFVQSDLGSFKSLSWENHGRAFTIDINQNRLRAAQEMIDVYMKLPDLAPITGCAQQTPLTLVRLKRRGEL